MAAEFQYIGFFVSQMPAFFDIADPGASAVRLASEKFGFAPADFNAGHKGRFHGQGRYGFTFEVMVKFGIAQTLAGKNHPDVLTIYE